MSDKSFLFITKSYWPGVVSCLDNMAIIIKEIYPSAKVGKAYMGPKESVFGVLKMMQQSPPDYLILGGWDNDIKLVVQNKAKKTTSILKWCSPITQIELGSEIPQFTDVWNISKTDKLDHIGFGLESDVEALNQTNDKFIHLPVYLDTNYLDGVNVNESVLREGINCDMFCAANPRKNILAQTFSLSAFNGKITTHINYGQNAATPYSVVCGQVLESLVNHQWIPDKPRYLSIIKGMDFALAVTLSESFNYTAAEHMYLGIPVICSEVIPFVKNEKNIEPIVIRRPEDLKEIQNAISILVNDEDARKELGIKSRNVFIKNNIKSKNILKNNLEVITR